MKTCRKCGIEKTLAEFHVHLQTKDGHNSQCKKCVIATAIAWRKANPKRAAVIQKKWNQKNPKKLMRATKKWRLANPEQMCKVRNAWSKAHPAQNNARNGRHRARKLQATPGWTNHIEVGEFYSLAALKTQLTGRAHEVDHIVPLRSRVVCGLHTHYNLQILSADENLSKGNRTWPDMPEARV